MATYDINKMTLPNGDIVNLLDETSGYLKTSGGTITGDLTLQGNANFSGEVFDKNNINYDVRTHVKAQNSSVSGEGWKRIAHITGPTAATIIGTYAFAVDISLGSSYNRNNNNFKMISLIGTHNNVKFVNETSVSNYNLFSKIRYMTNGTDGYIDIYYNSSTDNPCMSDFALRSAYLYGQNSVKVTPVAFTSVASAPSGETVRAEYTFLANGVATTLDTHFGGEIYDRRGYTTKFLQRTTNASQYSVGDISTAGWYRIIKFTSSDTYARGSVGFSLDISIGTVYAHTSDEYHQVSLLGAYNNLKFANETSRGASQYIITKIRYTTDGNGHGYIDIYYNKNVANGICCDFLFHPRLERGVGSNVEPVDFTSVTSAPSGETVQTEYTFAANGTLPTLTDGTVSLKLTDYGTQKLTFDAHYYRWGYMGIINVNLSGSTIQGLTFDTLLQIEGLPFTAIGASGFLRSLPNYVNDGMDTWQLAGNKLYLRKRGGGNITGTFGANPILQVMITGIYSG